MGGQGWAITIQQGMAVKGSTVGPVCAQVDEKIRAREGQARQSFDKASGKFKEDGSAGVQLYTAGANFNSVAESVKTNNQRKANSRRARPVPRPRPPRRPRPALPWTATSRWRRTWVPRVRLAIPRLGDKQFVAGFGSNGGEEFLSHMNISESLAVNGGDAWRSWDESISQNLNLVQNSDGSWSGCHCITGRTFCTSSALLVLMVDRSPQPTTQKTKER